jgi:hypothetical protein
VRTIPGSAPYIRHFRRNRCDRHAEIARPGEIAQIQSRFCRSSRVRRPTAGIRLGKRIAMIETRFTRFSRFSPGRSKSRSGGIPEPFDRRALEKPAHPCATAMQARDSPPVIRIPKRSRVRPWTIPRRLDPAMIGSRLILGKTRGLFLRAGQTQFRSGTAQARRAVAATPLPRKPRRWVPVVIWPVFPRGPLELPALGVLHKAKRWSIKTCRARPVRRNRSQTPDRVA